VNPITMAIAAAHAIAARAVADGGRPELLKMIVSDSDLDFPALDDALAELTGDELLTLALAADALGQRARTIENERHHIARAAAISEIKKNRKQV
jgi:hypothetical protein